MATVRVHELLDLYRSPAKDAGRKLAAALETTWTEPRPFLLEVFRHAALRSPRPMRSAPFDRYDVYHDGVLRHAGEGRVALRWLDRDGAWKELSFEDLHGRASRTAELWAEAGAEAGASVAVIAPPGPERWAALFAAWKLGLVPALLPARGERMVAARLAAAKPDHVSVATHFAWLAKGFEKNVLPEDDGRLAEPSEISHGYAAADPALRVFSPLAPDPTEPIDVAADDAVLAALRDAALAYGVGPGEALAAPGVDEMQHQPALMLAAALAGATWVELSLEDVDEDPRRLKHAKLASLGMPRPLREVLLAKPVDLSESVGHWWRPVDETAEATRIEDLAAACGLSKTPATNLLVDPALGGATQLSSARSDVFHLSTLPAAGLSYTLEDPQRSGERPAGRLGLFVPRPVGGGEGGPSSRLLLVREDDWLHGGHLEPRRFGRTYPSELALAALDDLPFAAQASVVALASPGAPNPHEFALLIFVGPRPPEEVEAEEGAWKELAAEAIRRRLGDEHAPDRVEVYPLHARRTEKGAVDHGWVQTQRVSGGLRRRTRSREQRALALLRSAAVLGTTSAEAALDM